MTRKKWTPKSDTDDAVVQSREKRKWQIALRRYVLERQKSSFYAPYFGLDIDKFREWIEHQFEEGCSWENFSGAWQFDHIVPVAYFDFKNEEDMRLCWSFINIRVQQNAQNKVRRTGTDVLAAKGYFESLYKKTGYTLSLRMVKRIEQIELLELKAERKLISFIITNKEYLETTATFTADDFNLLNTGKPLKSILFEKEFIKKLGG